jgi:hypothetical protein
VDIICSVIRGMILNTGINILQSTSFTEKIVSLSIIVER